MKYRIIVLVIFVTMFSIINAGFIEVSAELDEEQIKHLIKEEIGKLNRYQTWIEWVASIMGIAGTGITIFLALKLGKRFFDKRLERVEETIAKIEVDIAEIEEDIDDLYDRIDSLEVWQLVVIVVLLIFCTALSIIGFHLVYQ